jgi:hypothetical protein
VAQGIETRYADYSPGFAIENKTLKNVEHP